MYALEDSSSVYIQALGFNLAASNQIWYTDIFCGNDIHITFMEWQPDKNTFQTTCVSYYKYNPIKHKNALITGDKNKKGHWREYQHL